MTDLERAVAWLADAVGTRTGTELDAKSLAAEFRRVREACADLCMAIYREADNSRAGGYRRNASSPGCIAWAQAIWKETP